MQLKESSIFLNLKFQNTNFENSRYPSEAPLNLFNTFAVGDLRFAVGGLRFVVCRVCGWRYARLAVCAVGGLRGWRFARLAVCAVGVCAVGGLRGWRLRLAVCAVGGFCGWWLSVCGWCFVVGVLRLAFFVDIFGGRFAMGVLRIVFSSCSFSD